MRYELIGKRSTISRKSA